MSLRRPKPRREQDRDYRAWIGTLACIACAVEGRETHGCDCAHVSYLGEKGFGSKVSDRLTVPLCREHHDEQHRGAERLFWARMGVDPRRLTGLLSAAYPDTEAGEALIRSFAEEARRTPRLVVARTLGEPTERPAAPPTVTLEAHLTDGTDEHGNRAVILPTLSARGRGTSIAFIDPDALSAARQSEERADEHVG